MEPLDCALATLPTALRAGARQHGQDFLTAAQAVGLEPPPSAQWPTVLRVWVASEFVARGCIRDPALWADLSASGDLAQPYPTEGYAQRLAVALASVSDETALSVALRRFRRREMIRIAWRDLAGWADLSETLNDLSELAEQLVEASLVRLHQDQTQRFGQPRDADGQVQRLIVVGMGKLGGRELNFSSDIDLIFVYPRQGQSDGRKSISNEEFFRRLGQRLIKILAEPTAEGFVYRVDMRLRPFGDSGPLAISANAFEDYYQHHGRDWERYAMIKARVIAGDREAGERLLANLRPFVYRRYLDYGAFAALREMKTLITREMEQKGLQHHVKLGPGGIREIEFIGQAFQLIYGGREPALRERGIVKVLELLGASGRLPPSAARELQEAYAFLRRVENRLQAWADQQTHLLPEDADRQLRLAFAMGYADWSAFYADLTAHAEIVNRHFDQVFGGTPTAPQDGGRAQALAEVWRGGPNQEAALALLAEQGFADPARVWHRLRVLRDGHPYRTMSPRGQQRLDALLPAVLAAAVTTPQPVITLERVLELLETVARRSVYLALLADHPQALEHLVKLCAASGWIATHLARYPLVLDDLLNPAVLYAPLDRQRLTEQLALQWAHAPVDDPEEQLNALRYFKQTQMLRVAAADVSGALPLMIVSDHLTEIAETLLRQVLTLAWADLLPKFGMPRCVVDGVERDAGFAIIAYGKLGGIELNYGSDLDLVFLHDSAGEQQLTAGPRSIDNATFFTRLVQRIIHWLSTRTGAGDLYEVDTRLRPSGRAGLLVSSFAAFAEYQDKQAWTWEHQALTRARAVAGTAQLRARFQALRQTVLTRQRDPVVLSEEVRAMRERMRANLDTSTTESFDLKQGRGGIADIEFMVQYQILASACCHPDVLTYPDNIRQLDGLERAGVMAIADAARLRHAYRGLRRRIHQRTLQQQPACVAWDEAHDERTSVTRLWQRLMVGTTG